MKSFINEIPLTYEQIIEEENARYDEEKVDQRLNKKIVNLDAVLERNVKIFKDKSYNFPQAVFYISIKDYPYKLVGRKLRSVLSFENKINAPHCSMITSSMLLGILKSGCQIGQEVIVEYYPFNKDEKQYVFDSIKLDKFLDVQFPFKYLNFYTGKEKCSPDTGWSLNPEKVVYLGYGEQHIREYTVKFLKDIIKKDFVVYDPACSTGQFLNTIKINYNFCKTIGQDLSKEMVDYAKEYVDEIYCGDSINSPIPDESVDIMFFRFLNSEVVTTEYAYKLFDNLLSKLKKGGLAIIFGHTPVLIKSDYFSNIGLKVHQSIAYDEQRECIFQYYVLEK